MEEGVRIGWMEGVRIGWMEGVRIWMDGGGENLDGWRG